MFGLLVPKIYLPDVLENNEREYILEHERTHIKHGDWISKIVGMVLYPELIWKFNHRVK